MRDGVHAGPASGLSLMENNYGRNYPLPESSPLSQLPALTDVRDKISYSRRLGRLWEFIEEQYTDPDVHLADAARHSGVSPDHLNELLNRFADTTFKDLLSRYRVEKCIELFNERNYTITEVFTRCGFNSPTTFDRQFKKWVGSVPREYKKMVMPFAAG
jgi:AraC-like DNA-binding protein